MLGAMVPGPELLGSIGPRSANITIDYLTFWPLGAGARLRQTAGSTLDVRTLLHPCQSSLNALPGCMSSTSTFCDSELDGALLEL